MSHLFSRFSTRLRRLPRRHAPVAAPKPDLETLSRRIILPSMPVTDEEMARASYQDCGLKLARQEMWEELGRRIREADSTRAATPGGESGALLLAFGARSDVVAAAEDALHDGAAPAPDGIDALEAVGAEFAGDYAIALVVALAHVDLAWAWRGAPPRGDAAAAVAQAARHLARAADILDPHCGFAENAPSLAAAQCALMVGAQDRQEASIADHFEDLIDLDPASPRHMRALGVALLPERQGSYRLLELEARRTAARTGDIWGAGAYPWVYLDALALDHGALAMVDTAFFIDGLRDILRRSPDQHTANLLAAFCAVTLRGDPAEPEAARMARARLQGCLDWILRDHLHELHPLIWTQALRRPGASPLPSRRALISEGRQTALRAIAAQFADDIAGGDSIAFSPAGMYRLPSI
ncbi:hypothetical protein DC366_06160 [Pelagivirga sediminicola]|uniref:Uncharacterized protein n=1 Tax=Pelagivirga sediminicola TaxID=2170575 RepID=A0A2T7GA83_9RHOB|nr:hypothetical protein [Pelagivirga sediminicola]PVA11319.1 hypothetical protein DC366_06160 [Pelagivirga sediminicola]